MGKTKIEWCDYTINPVKGKCPMTCPYCYARRMYDRFKWNPEIRYDENDDLSRELGHPKFPDGSKVFVGSTMELFGDWINPKWLNEIFHDCWSRYPKVTFIFLTKQPQNLIKYSPFPENCWIGVSATNQAQYDSAILWLLNIEAKVRFLSIEPLLERLYVHPADYFHTVDWLIIGQQTPVKAATTPQISWVREIVEDCDKAGIPVFLKNNMMSLLKDCVGIHAPYWRITDPDNIWPYACQLQLRQEFPVLRSKKEVLP